MFKWTMKRWWAAVKAFRDYDLTRREKVKAALYALPIAETEEEKTDVAILRAYAMGQTLGAISTKFAYSETTVNKRINRYAEKVVKGKYRE